MQPVFEEVTPCAAPLIPISSQAHHDSKALCISRIYEVLTCFTTHWAPHDCQTILLVSFGYHHFRSSPSCLSQNLCVVPPWLLHQWPPVITFWLIIVLLQYPPFSSPFKKKKKALQHQGSFRSSTLKLGSTEQSQKGKHLNRRRFAKLWCYKQLLCWQLCHKEITSPHAQCF